MLDSETSPETRLAALRRLRFLDTPASLRELARRITSPDDNQRWHYMAGLVGSRHRELAMEELMSRIAQPDAAVNPESLSALRLMISAQRLAPLPPYPSDPEVRQQWVALRDEHSQQQRAIEDDLYKQAAALLSSKHGRARAITVQTLLGRPARSREELNARFTELPGTEISASFLALSPEQQRRMLESWWPRLKSPGMIDALHRLLNRPDLEAQGLRDTALRCLHEADPAAASRYILDEIRSPHLDGGYSAVSSSTLSLLPQETLPELDDVLAARLEMAENPTLARDARLTGRYATAAIASRVKKVYDSQDSAGCEYQDGMLTYFLRVEPDHATSRVRRHKGALCMKTAFRKSYEMNRWDDLEPVVIERLSSPELHVVRSAAEILAGFGGERARKALWERQAHLYRRWARHDAQFQFLPTVPPEMREAVGLQHGLIGALTGAVGWLLNDDEMAELEAITVGENERNNLRQRKEQWKQPSQSIHLVRNRYDGSLLASIASFSAHGIPAIHRKLSQFPPGTSFVVTTSGEPGLDSIAEELTRLGVEIGVTIERRE